MPALYLNLVLAFLLVANLLQGESLSVVLYLALSVLFNPLGAVLALCLGKWRAMPWFGVGLFLSFGVAALARLVEPPPYD